MLDDTNETDVGVGEMPHAPRVGELIWLTHYHGDDLGSTITQYRVVRVAYWVPELGSWPNKYTCQSCAVYVEKT